MGVPISATIHFPSGDKQVLLPQTYRSIDDAARELAFQIMKRAKEAEREAAQHGSH